jgi:hypothetical protein
MLRYDDVIGDSGAIKLASSAKHSFEKWKEIRNGILMNRNVEKRVMKVVGRFSGVPLRKRSGEE